MTFDEFREEVRQFIDLYISEYMNDTKVQFNIGKDALDQDEWEAEVIMEVPYNQGKTREMTIKLFSGEIGIQTYDDNYFDMTGSGLYCWLWHEAENELSKAS